MKAAVVALAGAVVAFAALAGVGGCALVMNLDGNEYTQAEAGACDGGDAGCVHPSFACTSIANCGDGGDVCCLGVAGGFTASCVASSQCTFNQLSVQLCAGTQECTGGGPCETCTVADAGLPSLGVCATSDNGFLLSELQCAGP